MNAPESIAKAKPVFKWDDPLLLDAPADRGGADGARHARTRTRRTS